MADVKVLSLLLNAELDAFGFNKETVKHRVEMYNKRSEAKAAATRKILKCDHIEKVIVGSRRDGISMEASDTDVLQINHGVICSSDALDFENEDEKVCLLLECDAAPPGYGFLSLNKNCDNNVKHFKDIENAVVHRRNKRYLSSDKYMKFMKKQQATSRRGWFGRSVKIEERKGPAIPKKLYALGFETDLVGAFKSSCKDVLQRWQDKDRPYDWPRKADVRSAAQLPVFVVAVGERGSKDEDLQWRISFNDAEMVLVQSLNDPQTKVLMMMRVLAKHVITPVCPDVTSYVIKNIMLQVAEQLPLKEFRQDTLIDRLFDCLMYLRNCIEEKRLPNYMNPERNLLQRKLVDAKLVANTIHVIDNVMERGNQTLLFYLTNKMRPEKLRKIYPRICNVKASLIKGNLEDRFAQKKVNAMTLDQLTDLHVHDDNCTSEFMLFIYELYYVYRPYVLKYGVKALRSDLSKIRSKFEPGCETLHLEGEMFYDEVNGEEEKQGELKLTDGRASDIPIQSQDDDVILEVAPAPDHGDSEPDPREFPDASEEVEAVETGVNGPAAQVYRYLLRAISIMKFMMLNLLVVIHVICLVSGWYSLWQFVPYENTYHVDAVGFVVIALIGISLMKKRIAQILDIFYIALLISIWTFSDSFSDSNKLYFQELMADLDFNDLDDYIAENTVCMKF